MSTNFPNSLDSYSTKVDNVDIVQAAHVNNLQDAVVAIETLLGYKNGITALREPNPAINGVPLVWQWGTSFAAIADATYTADFWKYGKSGAMVHTITQDTSVPTVAQAGLKIPYSVKLDVTTADASIAAGDYCYKEYIVTGFEFLGLAERQFTAGFWVRDTKTGIHCVSFRNSGTDRSYVAEFTINSADTWEYKTVTVSASPSAGTWSYTTGIGLRVTFTLASGSTYQTTADIWQTGNYLATSNQVNAVDSTSNDFYVTGLALTPGAYARPLMIPDFTPVYQAAQRYLRQKSFAYTTAPAQNVGVNTGELAFPATAAGGATVRSTFSPFPVIMAATPTITFYNPGAANANLRDMTAAADGGACTAFGQSSGRGFRIEAAGNAATAAGNIMGIHWTAAISL